jgi:hypothetical protein
MNETAILTTLSIYGKAILRSIILPENSIMSAVVLLLLSLQMSEAVLESTQTDAALKRLTNIFLVDELIENKSLITLKLSE